MTGGQNQRNQTSVRKDTKRTLLKLKKWMSGKKSVTFPELEKELDGKESSTRNNQMWRKYVAKQFDALRNNKQQQEQKKKKLGRGKKNSKQTPQGQPGSDTSSADVSFEMPVLDFTKRKKKTSSRPKGKGKDKSKGSNNNKSGASKYNKRKAKIQKQEAHTMDVQGDNEPSRTASNESSEAKLKRPANAYILFAQTCRREFKAIMPELDPFMVTHVMGQVWRFLSKNERKQFYQEARVRQHAYYEEKLSRLVAQGAIPEDGEADPKKPMNAFLLYCQDQRVVLHPNTTAPAGRRAVNTITRKWRRLSTKQKKAYQDRAALAMSLYQEGLKHTQKEEKVENVLPIPLGAKKDSFLDVGSAVEAASSLLRLKKTSRNNNKRLTDSETDGSATLIQQSRPSSSSQPEHIVSQPLPHAHLTPTASAIAAYGASQNPHPGNANPAPAIAPAASQDQEPGTAEHHHPDNNTHPPPTAAVTASQVQQPLSGVNPAPTDPDLRHFADVPQQQRQQGLPQQSGVIVFTGSSTHPSSATRGDVTVTPTSVTRTQAPVSLQPTAAHAHGIHIPATSSPPPPPPSAAQQAQQLQPVPGSATTGTAGFLAPAPASPPVGLCAPVSPVLSTGSRRIPTKGEGDPEVERRGRSSSASRRRTRGRTRVVSPSRCTRPNSLGAADSSDASLSTATTSSNASGGSNHVPGSSGAQRSRQQQRKERRESRLKGGRRGKKKKKKKSKRLLAFSEKSRQVRWKDENYPWHTDPVVSGVLCDEDICTRLCQPPQTEATALQCLYRSLAEAKTDSPLQATSRWLNSLQANATRDDSCLPSFTPAVVQRQPDNSQTVSCCTETKKKSVYFAGGRRSTSLLSLPLSGEKARVEAAFLLGPQAQVAASQCSSALSSEFENCPFRLPGSWQSLTTTTSGESSWNLSNFQISSHGGSSQSVLGVAPYACQDCSASSLRGASQNGSSQSLGVPVFACPGGVTTSLRAAHTQYGSSDSERCPITQPVADSGSSAYCRLAASSVLSVHEQDESNTSHSAAPCGSGVDVVPASGPYFSPAKTLYSQKCNQPVEDARDTNRDVSCIGSQVWDGNTHIVHEVSVDRKLSSTQCQDLTTGVNCECVPEASSSSSSYRGGRLRSENLSTQSPTQRASAVFYPVPSTSKGSSVRTSLRDSAKLSQARRSCGSRRSNMNSLTRNKAFQPCSDEVPLLQNLHEEQPGHMYHVGGVDPAFIPRTFSRNSVENRDLESGFDFMSDDTNEGSVSFQLLTDHFLRNPATFPGMRCASYKVSGQRPRVALEDKSSFAAEHTQPSISGNTLTTCESSLQSDAETYRRPLKRKSSCDSLENVDSTNNFSACSVPKYAFDEGKSYSNSLQRSDSNMDIESEFGDDLLNSELTMHSRVFFDLSLDLGLEIEHWQNKGWVL